MQNARILAAHIVVLATQDSLVTGKLAKVSESGSVINEFTKTKKIAFMTNFSEELFQNWNFLC